MIELQTKIHDSYSVEFKEGFVVPEEDQSQSQFTINTWLFVPSSLDLTAETYPKHLFWRDLKSQVRMITPVFTLHEMTKAGALPVAYLSNAMNRMAADPSEENVEEYVYQIKMFCAILKSATREETHRICRIADGLARPGDREADGAALEGFTGSSTAFALDLGQILAVFHSLRQIVAAPAGGASDRSASGSQSTGNAVPGVSDRMREVYAYGDEFTGHIVSLYAYRIIERMEALAPKSDACHLLKQLVNDISAHGREMGFACPDSTRSRHNDMLIYRHGVLKKFIESELFVSLKKKKDGIAAEQTLYALAAGIAMIFATIVSFSVQRKFGSLSIPLFFALIFSYMIKDRIKELSRYWFVHRLGKKYYDNKSTVSVKGVPVGTIKEGVDFIDYAKVPGEVLKLRSLQSPMAVGNDVLDEKVILYRKLVTIDAQALHKSGTYDVKGINDICRLHLARFTQKMDNPDQTLMCLDENCSLKQVWGKKIYYLNIVLQMCSGDKTEYRRYRLNLTRDGIRNIEEIS